MSTKCYANSLATDHRDEDNWRQVLAPPPRLTVSEWAEQNLILSERSTNWPGPYRTRRSPYVREILDLFADPSVSEITLCFAAQAAKTMTLMAMLCYAIDHDPGPSLWVMPNDDLCKSFSRQRLHPLLEDCPATRRHLPNSASLFGLQEMHFDRMGLAVVGSNSPANLSSRPVRYLFLDEVDKYPGASNKEAGAVQLAVKRTRAFWNRKIIRASTPTVEDGEIWRAFQRGDQRRYMVPCPHCGNTLAMGLSQLKFGHCKINGRWNKKRVRRETYYECHHCEHRITDQDKLTMLRGGRWEPTNQEGDHPSFHLSALYPEWVEFGEIADGWVESQGSHDQLRDFLNSTMAEPWINQGKRLITEELVVHVGMYQTDQCGPEPIALIVTVDVQENGFFYVIRAWTYRAASRLVRYGFLQTWQDVAGLFDQVFEDDEKKRLKITHCLVDSGARTGEVYEFCARTGATPIKGNKQYSQASMVVPGKAFSGLVIDKGQAADQLYHFRMMIRPGDPGFWELPRDVGVDYLDSILVYEKQERRTKTGKVVIEWKSKNESIEHYADCEIYQEAAAFFHGFSRREKHEQTKTIERFVSKSIVRSDGRGWLDKR